MLVAGCGGSKFPITRCNYGWSFFFLLLFLHKLFTLYLPTLIQLNIIWLVYCVTELVGFVCFCYDNSCWLICFVGVLFAVCVYMFVVLHFVYSLLYANAEF